MRAPAAIASAERDPEEDTGNPPTMPTARCTPPSATSSCLAVDLSGRRGLGLDRVRAGLERPSDQCVVAVGDNGQPSPAGQGGQVRQRDDRQLQAGQPRRHVADREHSSTGQVQDDGGQRRRRHRDQWSGPQRPEEHDSQQQGQRPDGHPQGRQVRGADHIEERADLVHDRLAVHLGTGDPAELTDHHEHRATGQIADQQRLGQQVGDHAELGQPGDQAPAGDDQAQCRAQCGDPLRVPLGQGATVAPASRATVDSGPTDSTRDPPSTA